MWVVAGTYAVTEKRECYSEFRKQKIKNAEQFTKYTTFAVYITILEPSGTHREKAYDGSRKPVLLGNVNRERNVRLLRNSLTFRSL